MKRICVFCGSSAGRLEIYQDEARKLGAVVASLGLDLVYGGGNVGLMGIVADAALASGGQVIGVIPQSIADLEIAHENLTTLHIVKDMGSRKEMMGELSDGFIALPGGYGTLDELSEVLTYNQLRVYDKPIGLLNVNGYFDGLLQFFDHAVEEKFVRQEHRNNLIVSADPEELVAMMESFEPVQIKKWIEDIKEDRAKN